MITLIHKLEVTVREMLPISIPEDDKYIIHSVFLKKMKQLTAVMRYFCPRDLSKPTLANFQEKHHNLEAKGKTHYINKLILLNSK